MSTLHQALDAMDDKLDDLETGVKVTDKVAMETEAYKEIYRGQILREHDELVGGAVCLNKPVVWGQCLLWWVLDGEIVEWLSLGNGETSLQIGHIVPTYDRRQCQISVDVDVYIFIWFLPAWLKLELCPARSIMKNLKLTESYIGDRFRRF